jgi:hypothetical protein
MPQGDSVSAPKVAADVAVKAGFWGIEADGVLGREGHATAGAAKARHRRHHA